MFYERGNISRKFLSLSQAIDAAHDKPAGSFVFIEDEDSTAAGYWCVIAKVEGLIWVGRPMNPLPS